MSLPGGASPTATRSAASGKYFTSRLDTAARVLVHDAVGAVLFAVVASVPYPWDLSTPSIVVVVISAAALSVRRTFPGSALGLAWAAALTQIVLSERPSLAQAATVVVIYSCAAYGSRFVLLASAAAVVVGSAIATPYLVLTGARYAEAFLTAPLEQRIVIAALPFVALALSWVVGYAIRIRRSRTSAEVARTRAEEQANRATDLAESQRARADIARDVHDVVGHSLAVIIAQADAAELTDDPVRVQEMVQNIGRTARTSLQEVRSVLADPLAHDLRDEPTDETLDEIVDRVAAAAPLLRHQIIGSPIPLAPESAIVARRLLQEMLTNALRHGLAEAPIMVTRTYRAHALIIDVENSISATSNAGSGHGLRGMRGRLAEIGGTLEYDTVDKHFLVRARIPTVLESSRG